MRGRRWIATWAQIIVATAIAVPLSADERQPDLELVLLSGRSLERLAVQVDVDGKSFAKIWDENFAALTAYFDRNGDGSLDKAEAARLPSVQALREVLSLGFAPALGAPPAWETLDANSDGRVSAAEVARFYRQAGIGTPLVGGGFMPFTADLTASLLQLLDADNDGQVDDKEWKQAPQALPKLDRNDDELIGAGELVSKVLYPGASGSLLLLPPQANQRANAATEKISVVVLSADSANTAWADEVVRRRDANRDGVLSGEEAGFSAANLAVLDANDDRSLSPAELATWRTLKADITLTLGLTPNGRRLTLTTSAGSSTAAAASIAAARPGLQIVARSDEGKGPSAAARVAEHFTSEFADADANSDGVLTDDEIVSRKESTWKAIREAADNNGDKQLSKAELDAWLVLQRRLAAGQLLMTALDGGRGLFELLDANHDGALSLKELREAAGKVQSSGAVVDGKLDVARFPAHLLLTLSQGYPQSPLGATERTGPAWFLAMDRNTDGFVSRREFSGPPEVFQKLDMDRDQLLSPAEVEQARN